MGFEHPQGLIAVILAIISFYGMTYVVLALNVGWRFGYWLASAAFGALMVLISIFWLQNPVGPRGPEARWVPLAASRGGISQATLKEKPLTSPAQYPMGDWRTSKEQKFVSQHFAQRVSLLVQSDALVSAVSNCVTSNVDKLEEAERAPCEAAQKLMPPDDEIPVIEGSKVSVAAEARNTRFTLENGALLGQTTVVPMTHDPRVAKNPIKGKVMGPSFRLLAVYDKGSLRLPPFMSLLIFIVYFAFHLRGLHRAEQRKLSPVA